MEQIRTQMRSKRRHRRAPTGDPDETRTGRDRIEALLHAARDVIEACEDKGPSVA